MIFIFTIIVLIFSVFLIVFSALSVRSRNLVHGAVWLMLFMFSMAGLFVYLGTDFVASIELLVYVGAVITLLVFTLMLTGGKDIDAGQTFTPVRQNITSISNYFFYTYIVPFELLSLIIVGGIIGMLYIAGRE